jgi:hypothetical protein
VLIFTQIGVLYGLKSYTTQHNCSIINDNSGKAWSLDTHRERTEVATAVFMNRTTESDTENI